MVDGNDVTLEVHAKDDLHISLEGEVGWKYVEIVLDQVPAATPVHLVLDFRTVPTGEQHRHLIHGEDFVKIFSFNPSSGHYFDKPVATVSDRKENLRLVVADVGQTSLGPQMRLKIGFFRKTHIDFIGWSASHQPQLKLTQIDFVGASLHETGHRLQTVRVPGAPYYDFLMETNDHAHGLSIPSGNYTRHGDVTELVVTADDALVVMAPGDTLTLQFKQQPSVTPRENPRYVMSGKAWYKATTDSVVFAIQPKHGLLHTRQIVESKQKRGSCIG